MNIFALIISFLFFNNIANADIKSILNTASDFVFDETYKEDKKFKRHIFDLESGVVMPVFNDIRTGKDKDGTLSLTDLQNNVNPYFRLSYYFNLDKKNGFRVLVAPLEYSGSGYLDHDTNYEGMNLLSGNLTNYSYKFNSYRFTYRRTIFENEMFTFKLGLTLKIRDAAISVSQGNLSHKDSNVGFVPLGYINFEFRPIEKLTIGTEGDLAAAPQGSAIDVGTFVKYNIHENVALGLMYRFLSGGVSTENSYNQTFINYFGATFTVMI